MTLSLAGTALLCAAFFLAGIVDAVCGGGGLLTLPAFLSVGFPAHMISGTNQCSTLLGGTASFLSYLKSGHIHWRTALPTVPLTVIGAFLGAQLNLLLPEETLEAVMVILLPIASAALLLKRDFGRENRADTLSARHILAGAVFIGLVVGGYQGFYAAGAGTFFILAFALIMRLDLLSASGNAKLVALCSNITASVTYALSGSVAWRVVLAATLFNIAGNLLGAHLAIRRGARLIRPVLLGILVLLFLRVAASLL